MVLVPLHSVYERGREEEGEGGRREGGGRRKGGRKDKVA